MQKISKILEPFVISIVSPLLLKGYPTGTLSDPEDEDIIDNLPFEGHIQIKGFKEFISETYIREEPQRDTSKE